MSEKVEEKWRIVWKSVEKVWKSKRISKNQEK